MPTPVQWLANQQSNTGTANTPTTRQSEITGLANGNYLVSWVEDGTSGVATDSGQDIVGQLYDAVGNTIGSAFQLNTRQTLGDQDDFEVVATADGGFLMTYRSEVATDDFDIVTERFDSLGTQQDSGLRTFAEYINVSNPQLAYNLNTLESLVVYTAFETDSFFGDLDDNLNGNLRDSGLNAISSVTIDNTLAFDENNHSVAVNTNGEYVVTYVDGGLGIGQAVVVRVFSSAGVLQHDVTVETGLDDNADPRVITLSNGNIAVVWAEEFPSSPGDYDIKGIVYDQNLNVVASQFTIANSSAAEDDVSLIALPQGGWVIAWDQAGSQNGLYIQLATNDGLPDGNEVRVAAGSISNAELGVTVDGRILYTYTENGNIFHGIYDPRGDVIEVADFDPSGQSTNFVEGDVVTARQQGGTINGTTGDDTILGQAGDDIIDGDLGTDTITGGGGDDTLTAEWGSSIDGGDDDDDITVTTALGNASVAGSELTGGNSGTDTLTFEGFSFGVGVDLLDGEYGTRGDFSFGGGGVYGSVSGFETVTGTDEADYLQAGNNATTLNGRDGNDILRGGLSRDTLNGGDDDDTLDGGDDLDTLNGGNGNDRFVLRDGDDIDNVDGGADTDTLDLWLLTGSGDAVQIFLGSEFWMGRGGGAVIRNIEIIEATQADDRIEGGTTAITVNGNDGDDTIVGSSQADTLNGGDDNDNISGGSGADTINGGEGDDTIRGGGSSDIMDGGDGVDTLLVDEFNGAYEIDLETGVTNFVETAVNFENVTTGNGDDVIVGWLNDFVESVIHTNGGDDTIRLLSIADHDVDAGDDTDTLVLVSPLGGGFSFPPKLPHTINLETGVYEHDDTVSTFLNFENFTFDSIVPTDDVHNITVTNSAADNVITLAEGNDTIIDTHGILSKDTYDGGDGIDTLIYTQSFASGFTFDLAAGTQTPAIGNTLDTFTSIENLDVNGAATILGSDADNILRATGTDAGDANIINGRGGEDTIFGGAGNDTINGGSGKDILNGEDGDDTFVILGADLLDDNDLAQVDDIIGGAGTNTLDLSDITSTSVPGVDVSVRIVLENGSWVIFADGSVGAGQISDIDIIEGSDFDDTLDAGNATALELYGNGGNDRLVAGTNGTDLDGGADDDVLIGGAGEDAMTGGTGADTFQFVAATDTGDLITDFTIGEDKMDLSELLRGIDAVKLVAVGEGKGGTDLFLDHSQNIGHSGSSRVLISAEQDGSDTILTITNRAPIVGDAPDLNIAIELWNVDASELSLSDFIL